MKIAYYGDGPWAHRSLERLLQGPHEIVVIVVRYDHKDEVLVKMGKENGIPVLWTERVNTSDWIERMKSFEADLAISMSFNQIIRETLRKLYPQGFINVHAGKLPNYRGRNILNWALINDEKEIGVTCHYIDDGIDTGDIILQDTFAISDEDDYASVLQRAIQKCPNVLMKAVEFISNNDVNRTKQPFLGSYFIARREGDEWIDWAQSSREVFNFVRAITSPGPWARSSVKREHVEVLVKIGKVRVLQDFPNYKCVNGAVIGFDEEKLPIVKTGKGAVVLLSYTASEESFKLRIGDRLIK